MAFATFGQADIIDLLILFSLLLSLVLGWNNSGLTTGNLSNLIKYGTAVSITLAGAFVGFLVEGSKMSHSILGKVVVTQLLGVDILSGVFASLAFFLILSIVRIPVSLSNCAVGAFVGVALESRAILSSEALVVIVASWILAPFVCAFLTIAIYSLLSRLESSMSLPNISWINRLVLIASVFYVSYAIGANNLGFIFSFIRTAEPSLLPQSLDFYLLQIAIFIALATGTILFGKALAKVVSDKIVGLSQIKTLAAILGSALMVWSLTQLSVPVSLTQIVIGGMLGASAAKGPSVVNNKKIFVMIRDWSIVTVLCIAMGYGLDFLLHFG